MNKPYNSKTIAAINPDSLDDDSYQALPVGDRHKWIKKCGVYILKSDRKPVKVPHVGRFKNRLAYY